MRKALFKNIKVVIFDCDGVMFDTREANRSFYNQIMAHFGKGPMTCAQFEYVHMHTVEESVAHILADDKLSQKAMEYRKHMDYQPFIRLMRPEPGLKPLLEKLKGKYHNAIATNRTDSIHAVLTQNQLADYFDLVVSALDVSQPKPHPEQLFKILQHFNITAEQAIYVGDSRLDESAAKAAEVIFVAYDNKRLSAEVHINRLEALENLLL